MSPLKNDFSFLVFHNFLGLLCCRVKSCSFVVERILLMTNVREGIFSLKIHY